MMHAAQAGALRYIRSVRRIFVICVLLLGSAFLTQTVSASIASYAHCCIADCDDGSACAMPGCQPCGTPLMTAPRTPLSGMSLDSAWPLGVGSQWASWNTSVWRPPD